MRQIREDGGSIAGAAEADDPRLNALVSDLAMLDEAPDDRALVEQLAARYWVP